MTTAVTVDVAGARMGGAARYKHELCRYLDRTRRQDVRVIGEGRSLGPAWLLRREIAPPARARRVALNNVSFVAPGGERWTLLASALHFLTDKEESGLDPSLRAAARRQAAVVRLAARRSDVIVVPSTTMAQRVTRALPGAHDRMAVRPHPLSADSIPRLRREPVIVCPVLFAPYKQMHDRLRELLLALDDYGDSSIRVRATAEDGEVPADLACHPRIELVGRVGVAEALRLHARSRAIYFPTSVESFGYPLAEARVSGHPVVALDTAQNREIAGPALCGFAPGDTESLSRAIGVALTRDLTPDPAPFDPDAYFGWLLGSPR